VHGTERGLTQDTEKFRPSVTCICLSDKRSISEAARLVSLLNSHVFLLKMRTFDSEINSSVTQFLTQTFQYNFFKQYPMVTNSFLLALLLTVNIIAGHFILTLLGNKGHQ